MPRFTRENASEMARRGNLARWSRPRRPVIPPAIPAAIAPDTYPTQRLARVREQLALVDDAIEREAAKPNPDAHKVDRLAAASMRLSDQEFALAGRPKPGNRKPLPDRRSHQERPAIVAVPMPTPAESLVGDVTPVAQPMSANTEPVPVVPASTPVPKVPEVRPAEVVPTSGPPVGKEVGFGFELAPGVWKEAAPPSKPDPQALRQASEEAARLRLLRRRQLGRQPG